MSSRIFKCLRLNARMGYLVLKGKWLGVPNFASSYDKIAEYYNDNWLNNIKPVTDELISKLGKDKADIIYDLGCGTGYSSEILAEMFPVSKITAVDSSEKMLANAINNSKHGNLIYKCDDMLKFLCQSPDEKVDLVFSAWAIGYSNPVKIIRQVSRTLMPGGQFAFVVNCSDTLSPVFNAFRKTMFEFPESPRFALWPRFPENLHVLEEVFRRNNLEPIWSHEDRHLILAAGEKRNDFLSWIMKTGIMAGFEKVLPLEKDGPVRRYFEKQLLENKNSLEHHYISAVLRKK